MFTKTILVSRMFDIYLPISLSYGQEEDPHPQNLPRLQSQPRELIQSPPPANPLPFHHCSSKSSLTLGRKDENPLLSLPHR